ncbi:MAG: glutamine--tRNA ligase/YqeY domain fusion protein [Candidatus Bipolaricaulota bacterium]
MEQTRDFIRKVIDQDLREGRYGGRVHTRFPPEPNAYLHLGHAKAIFLSFGIAREYGGRFNLRFDDTNPQKATMEYIEAITDDVAWLGAEWDGPVRYASDYFEQLYGWAEELVRKDKAYVCDLSPEEISEQRGQPIRKDDKIITPPGVESPYRNRSVEENLDLLRRMRAGEFPDGAKTLRAKIDMAHPNLNMRDPVMYRILHAPHPRTGDVWCIYPTYDWAHGQSDSIEGITHSICTLEFENHRPLYDWFLENLEVHRPRQIEFARLNVTHMVMSKRMLLRLVREGYVERWDDPRMPTLAALRRRGYTPEAIEEFTRRVGVSKSESAVEYALLEHCVRQDLNKRAARRMAVLDPLRVVITNYPEDQTEEFDAVNNPEDPSAGTRKVPFSGELFIEREDFMEDPPKKFFRLAPGREVRLRYAYFIRCEEVVKDASGQVVELRCTYDPATRGGDAPDGRKVKATLHWVSATHAARGEVRLYEQLFDAEDPRETAEGADWIENVNPTSLVVLHDCQLEPSLAQAEPGQRFQFERKGYFCVDPDSRPGAPVFNRTATLRDEWKKIQARKQSS